MVSNIPDSLSLLTVWGKLGCRKYTLKPEWLSIIQAYF